MNFPSPTEISLGGYKNKVPSYLKWKGVVCEINGIFEKQAASIHLYSPEGTSNEMKKLNEGLVKRNILEEKCLKIQEDQMR